MQNKFRLSVQNCTGFLALALSLCVVFFMTACELDNRSRVPSFTVTFHSNGGSGSVPAPQTGSIGEPIEIPGGGDLSKNEYYFVRWNTEPDGSGIDLGAGCIFSPAGNVALYAVWLHTRYFEPIRNAAVEVSTPVRGQHRDAAAAITIGEGMFRAGTVTWSPTSNPSTANTLYRATVTLTATGFYTFTGGLTETVTINGRRAEVLNNDGTSAELSFEFQVTEADRFWENWHLVPLSGALRRDGNYRVTGDMTATDLVVSGRVTIYVPAGSTLTVIGSAGTNGGNGGVVGGHRTGGTAATGGNAAIRLESGNTLILRGGGTVNATGGRGGNAGRGANGQGADNTYTGRGGGGGAGAGGGGAGIGTNGGSGGAGGAGGTRVRSQFPFTNNGGNGTRGGGGGNSVSAGTLYVLDQLTVIATGGNGGSNGGGGSGGSGSGVRGGGGGGGGGGAGANGANTGAGGAGAGGGGGGGGGGAPIAGTNHGGQGGAGGSSSVSSDGASGSNGHNRNYLGGSRGGSGPHGTAGGHGVTARASTANAAAILSTIGTFNITYNDNGTNVVSMPVPNPQLKFNNAAEFITHLVPTRAGYTFIGWNNTNDGSGEWFFANHEVEYSHNAALTLFAIWE